MSTYTSTVAIGESRAQVGPFSRYEDRVVMGLLVLVGAVGAGVRFNDQLIGLTGDNAAYILLGRALVIGEPYNNGEYPWGYPALLAPVLAAVGPNNILEAVPWMKLLTLGLFLGSLPLMYALFRTRHAVPAAFAATLLFAVNSVTLLYANDVMSEIPFVFAGFAALLYWQLSIAPWARQREPAETPWPRLVIAGALVASTYYIRSVGLALFAGAVLVLLWYRKLRAALGLGLLLALAALPWVVFSSSVEGPTYAAKLLLRDPYRPELGQISSAGEFIWRIVSICWLYLDTVFPAMLLPDPTPEVLRSVLAPALFLLVAVGLALRLSRGVELPEIYTILFLVVISAWPWRADRFLLPVYPLLLHYLMEAVTWSAKKIRNSEFGIRNTSAQQVRDPHFAVGSQGSEIAASRSAPTSNLHSAFRIPHWALLLLLIFALPNLWLAGVAGAENLGYLTGRAQPSGHTPDWQSYFAACRWLQDNTSPQSVVLSRKSTLTTIYSSRPSVLIPLIAPDKYPDFLRQNRVDYVIEDAFEWSTQTHDYLVPALRTHPEVFELAYTTAPPETRVWKVRR
jgi:hypothetical protein